MSYLSECLADSPDVLCPMSTYSSGYADSSGNSRDLDVVSGTAPASSATGPDGNPAAAWGASAGFLRTTFTQLGPSVGTYEFWFRYAAAPTANLIIATWCPNSGTDGGETYVAMYGTGAGANAGKLSFSVNNGSPIVTDSPSALTTGVWHHVVCSWGAGGMVMRIDKTTVGTAGATSAITKTSSLRLHGYWSGAADILQTGAIDMGWAAFYPTQLTNTRTDAHYDAMAAPTATASLSLSGSAAPASPASATGTLSLAASAVTGDIATGTGALTLSGTAGARAAAGATAALSLTGSGSAVMATTATAHLDLSATAAAIATYLTDTTNSHNGRTRRGRAVVIINRPPAPPPAGRTFGTRYDKAIAYPTPVMVDGRPT